MDTRRGVRGSQAAGTGAGEVKRLRPVISLFNWSPDPNRVEQALFPASGQERPPVAPAGQKRG